jgi:hypothetical protein
MTQFNSEFIQHSKKKKKKTKNTDHEMDRCGLIPGRDMQPPVQWILGVLSTMAKQFEHEADNYFHLVPRLRMCGTEIIFVKNSFLRRC